MARSVRSKRRKANNALKRERLVKAEAIRLKTVTEKLDEITDRAAMVEDLTPLSEQPGAKIKITMEVETEGIGKPKPLKGVGKSRGSSKSKKIRSGSKAKRLPKK